MRLGDLDALKEALISETRDKFEFVCLSHVIEKIDNAPTIICCSETPEGYPLMDLRPKGECRTCRHRDPEDKKCDCGGQERQGCPFPVSDDYYCKYYER